MIEFNGNIYILDNSFERKMLHQDLESAFAELYEPSEEAYEELQKAHDLISAQDVEGLVSHDIDLELFFNEAKQNDLLAEALKEAGYKVEQSGGSLSHYVINDNSQEVRISDHKRPAFQTQGAVDCTEHVYENELIVDGNTVTATQLSDFGIELEEGRYFLG